MNSEPETATNIIPLKTVCNVNGTKEIQKWINSMLRKNSNTITV